MSPAETTRKGALAATANFLAIDRGDIVYCAQELARHTARPTTADWEQVVRLGRYLKNRPRVRWWYTFQETPYQLETCSDTDWAGCRRTRRSTTGGCTVAGSHLVKMWCKTQAVVALNSADAKLYGLVRALAETNVTLIDVQRPRHAYECGQKRVGQNETSGHQLFLDPRESCKG